MVSLGSRIRPMVGLLLALGLGEFARGAEPLAGASPFLPPATAANGGAKAPDTPIELRGIVTDSGSTMFSIYDPAHHSASWAKLNEIGRDFIGHAEGEQGGVAATGKHGALDGRPGLRPAFLRVEKTQVLVPGDIHHHLDLVLGR